MVRHGGRRKIRIAAACAALSLLAAACTGGDPAGSPTAASSSLLSGSTGGSVQLKVGVYNIENGGIGVDFSKVVEAAKTGGADVLGVEEATGNIPRLAKQAGYPYYSVREQVISKFPILDDPAAQGEYLLIQLSPGKVVAMENVHLPSAPYGPYWVKRANKDATQIERMETRRKLPSLQPQLDASAALKGAGIPVFLTGDFNSPSYRDWIPSMVGARQYLDFSVDWPISHAVEDAGFVDSYRAIYPDPMKNPGITWWAGRPDAPGWDAQTTASEIVGEPGAQDVSIQVNPWPGDHRSVVSTFQVTPGSMPQMVVADTRRVEIGQPLTVTYHGAAVRIDVVPAADGGAPTETHPVSAPDGTLTVPTDSLSAGAYDVLLFDSQNALISTFPFWAVEPGAHPVVTTDKSTYQVGDTITVAWEQSYGERWDWIGVYRQGADPNIAYYLEWDYTDAAITGSLPIDEGANGRWPLKAGTYSVYLLRDDGYEKDAGVDFTIK